MESNYIVTRQTVFNYNKLLQTLFKYLKWYTSYGVNKVSHLKFIQGR